MPVTTALQRLPPVAVSRGVQLFPQAGRRASIPTLLRQQLTLAGYSHVTQVVSPGRVQFRGGVIDLFPMGSALPYRIDLFDDEIESIRTFDVDTQRSIYKVNEVRLLPAREFPPMKRRARVFARTSARSSKAILRAARSTRTSATARSRPASSITCRCFSTSTATHHRLSARPTPSSSCTATFKSAIEAFWRDTRSRYELLRGDRDRPLLPPQELVPVTRPVVRRDQAVRAHRDCAGRRQPKRIQLPTAPLPPLQVDRRADNPLHNFTRFLRGISRPRAADGGKRWAAAKPCSATSPSTA